MGWKPLLAVVAGLMLWAAPPAAAQLPPLFPPPPTPAPPPVPVPPPPAGGSITISQTSQPDYLDPALTYTVNGIEPLWLVYTPLLTYARAEGDAGTQLIPGLAESLPEISAGGKKYELRLRAGLTYSDGTAVVASDFEHTIMRVLRLESGGSAFFRVIAGAERYAKRTGGDISGIETDDRTGAITIKLTRPNGTFSNVLAMWFAGLVPGDTPFRNMTRNPPPGVGPYMVTDSTPNREFVLERNPAFAVPGIPAGQVDRITTKIVRSTAKQARDVIDGDLDYMQDPPPAAVRRKVMKRYGDRYEEHLTASTYYMFLNSRVPPFDSKKVRQAVNYAVDKRVLARAFGGMLEPGCSFLPPGMPGYDSRLDTSGCPWGDPSRKPQLGKARKLIRQAGAKGEKVTVWGNNDDPTDLVTKTYARMLNRIGLRAKAKIVDGGVYFQTIGDRRTRPQTGFANWFADIPHPANFFFLVDGRTISPTNNQNFGNVDDPQITRGIAGLTRQPILTPEVVRKWSRLNAALVRGGHIVPYGHIKLPTFMSERMNFAECSLFHPVYFNDYSSFCLG